MGTCNLYLGLQTRHGKDTVRNIGLERDVSAGLFRTISQTEPNGGNLPKRQKRRNYKYK
jgi:hypothetical protein